MTCPICKKSGARRSHRQTVADHVLSILGVYPWRCQECHAAVLFAPDAIELIVQSALPFMRQPGIAANFS